MSERKKRTKALRLKKIIEAADPIMRVDQQTFYHKSADPDRNGEPYFVFMSLNPQNKDVWSCDCMHFTMMIRDSNSPTPPCKHIKAIIEKFSL